VVVNVSGKHSNKDNQLISQQRELTGQNVRELIKWLRSRDNLTQTEFAQRVGINRSLICQYESGERLPSMESIIKLAVYSGQSADSLLGLGEAKHKLNKGEEKIIRTLRKMSAGHELTVKKENTYDQDIPDELIAVRQTVKI
jgi:transcriptional regulator with XRE-family HTH domain